MNEDVFKHNGITITTGDYDGREATVSAVFFGDPEYWAPKRRFHARRGVIKRSNGQFDLVSFRTDGFAWFSRYELYFDDDTRPVYWGDVEVGTTYLCLYDELRNHDHTEDFDWWKYYESDDEFAKINELQRNAIVTVDEVVVRDAKLGDVVVRCRFGEKNDIETIVPWTTLFREQPSYNNPQRLVYEFNEWKERRNKR